MSNHSAPFEGHGVKQKVPSRVILIVWMATQNLGEDVEVVIFPSEMPSPWFCFNLGDRKFGIWIETLKLYEADEHGAMGEDPINPSELQ